MLTIDTEHLWWDQLALYLYKKLETPILAMLDTPTATPYTVLEKKGWLRSFDGMAVDFALHFFHCSYDGALEDQWLSTVRHTLQPHVSLPMGKASFQETRLSRRVREKKGYQLSADYTGLARFSCLSADNTHHGIHSI